MTARNETTRDLIKSKPTNQAFRDGWDRIESGKLGDDADCSDCNGIGSHHPLSATQPRQGWACGRCDGSGLSFPPQPNPKAAIKDVFKPKNNNS